MGRALMHSAPKSSVLQKAITMGHLDTSSLLLRQLLFVLFRECKCGKTFFETFYLCFESTPIAPCKCCQFLSWRRQPKDWSTRPASHFRWLNSNHIRNKKTQRCLPSMIRIRVSSDVLRTPFDLQDWSVSSSIIFIRTTLRVFLGDYEHSHTFVLGFHP